MLFENRSKTNRLRYRCLNGPVAVLRETAMLKQKSSEYRGYRTAGIRLREEMLPQLKDLYGAHTHEMLPAVHAFDKAHTVMLVEEGLLDSKAGAACLRGLRRMEAEGVVKVRSQVGGGL